MDSVGLPELVESFLRDHITSYEQLEILLLLRTEPARAWSLEEVAQPLSIARPAATAALAHLRELGLVVIVEEHGGGDGARYALAEGPAELSSTVAALAVAYDEDRAGVMRALSRNAIARLRSRAMRAFLPDHRKG